MSMKFDTKLNHLLKKGIWYSLKIRFYNFVFGLAGWHFLYIEVKISTFTKKKDTSSFKKWDSCTCFPKINDMDLKCMQTASHSFTDWPVSWITSGINLCQAWIFWHDCFQLGGLELVTKCQVGVSENTIMTTTF